MKVKKGRGCDKCNGKGYKGRTGLYEVMEVDDELRELILVGASALELKKKAMENGMITLRRSGLIKVKTGVTTMEEVARETVYETVRMKEAIDPQPRHDRGHIKRPAAAK